MADKPSPLSVLDMVLMACVEARGPGFALAVKVAFEKRAAEATEQMMDTAAIFGATTLITKRFGPKETCTASIPEQIRYLLHDPEVGSVGHRIRFARVWLERHAPEITDQADLVEMDKLTSDILEMTLLPPEKWELVGKH